MEVPREVLSQASLKLLEDAIEGKFPPEKRLGELRDGEMNVCIRARVSSVFIKRDFGKGSYRRIELEDETGSAMLVLFNEQLEHTKKLMVGDEVLLTNCYVENGELHLSPTSQFKVLEPAKVLKPSELREEGRFNIQGRVVVEDGELYLESEGIAVPLSGKLAQGVEGKDILLSYVLFRGGKLIVDERTRIFIKRS